MHFSKTWISFQLLYFYRWHYCFDCCFKIKTNSYSIQPDKSPLSYSVTASNVSEQWTFLSNLYGQFKGSFFAIPNSESDLCLSPFVPRQSARTYWRARTGDASHLYLSRVGPTHVSFAARSLHCRISRLRHLAVLSTSTDSSSIYCGFSRSFVSIKLSA